MIRQNFIDIVIFAVLVSLTVIMAAAAYAEECRIYMQSADQAEREIVMQTDKPAETSYKPVYFPSPNGAQLGIAPEPTAAPELTYIGEFVVTAYCPCEICCGKWSDPDNPLTASGAPAIEGVTVGADWDTLPPGTVIYIEGVGQRTVQDKPAGWIVEKYGGHILDLYFAEHQDALEFGKQELKVWIVES